MKPSTVARLGRVLLLLPLAGYAIISLYPFAWMVSAAFKNSIEVRNGGHLIPHQPTLHTLVETWSRLHFFQYFTNSLLITGGTVLGVLVLYSLAAYAFAVLEFPGRKWLYRMFVLLLFVPPVTVLLPVVLIENQLGLLGGRFGLILPIINGSAPLAVLLLTTAFSAIPGAIRESARIDGASEWRIFWRLYLPLARPSLITIGLLTVVPTWNEYVLSRVSLSNPDRYTLPLGLQNLLSSNVPQYNQLMAASLITVLPIVALFLVLQRYFVNGIVGAVKG